MVTVIGLMRFSVVTADNKNAWRATKTQSLEDSIARMLSPDRLRLRLKLARAMPLASLAGQTDPGFKLKVLISSEVPSDVRADLASVEAEFPFAQLVAVRPDEDLLAKCREFVVPGQLSVTFRLDDDDAVNREFIADLKELAVPANLNKVLSFPHGVYVAAAAGKLVLHGKVYPNNAFGLSYLSDDGRTIFDMRSHSKIFQHPMVLHPRANAWMRSIHSASDSGNKLEAGALRHAAPAEMAALYPEFRIDADALLNNLPPIQTISNLAILRQAVRTARQLVAERSAIGA